MGYTALFAKDIRESEWPQGNSAGIGRWPLSVTFRGSVRALPINVIRRYFMIIIDYFGGLIQPKMYPLNSC